MNIDVGPRVTCRLIGQLGNQLFTYFAALALASRQRVSVSADAFFATRTGGLVSLQSCILPEFEGLHGDHRLLSALVGASRREGLHVRFADGLQRSLGREIFRSPVVGYAGSLEELEGRDVTIDGYYQTYLYVEEARSRLGLARTQVVRADSPSPWLIQLMNQAMNVSPIGLHIRGADDYRKAGIRLNTRQYLSDALPLVDASDERSPIWVFSDDLDYARSVVQAALRYRTQFVPIPQGTRPIEVMLALACTHSIITANSTFSWWSAYLSGHDRVVTPAPWMPAGEMSELDFGSNLIPSQWMSVPATFV